jgi:predicted MFS family arabinose efflux permease
VIVSYVLKLQMFSRDVRLYLITSALVGFCLMGIYAVLFNLYLLRLGYSPGFIGLTNAISMLAYALFALPAGALGARWGVRRMMIVGLGLGALGIALPPLNEFIPSTGRQVWLPLTYALGNLGGALYVVNADVFLMEATGPEERSYAFSMQVALWPLAAFAGSLVGGVLPELISTVWGISLDGPAPYRYSLLTAAALFALGVPALLATATTEPVQKAQTASQAGPAPYALIFLLALVQFLQGAGGGAARTFFNVYLDLGLNVATPLIGALTAVSQLLAVPAALATPLLLARWRNGPTFVRSTVGVALSILPLALIPRWGAAGAGFMGMMAWVTIGRPSFLLYRMNAVLPAWRTLQNGATNMAFGLSTSAMALGGGYMATRWGWSSLFLAGAALTASGALLFWLCFRVPGGKYIDLVAEGSAAG